MMRNERVSDLLYQALQTEQDGARVYETAIRCAVNDGVKQDWARYLGQTRQHEQALIEVFDALGLDPAASSPGREAARLLGRSLVDAMESALGEGPSETAQLIACECVVHAETKDRLNWELLGQVAGRLKGEEAEALSRAYRRIGHEEDEHLERGRGWTRQLWLESLGLPESAGEGAF
jgi:hypothetical protein